MPAGLSRFIVIQCGPIFDEDGLIWRHKAGSDVPCAVTIMEYREYWHPRAAALIQKIATALHEPEPVVRDVIAGLTARHADGMVARAG